MKRLPPTYNPTEVEPTISRRWEQSRLFNPDRLPRGRSRRPFSIAMPPVNVTGELHLGHSLFLTTQDIVIRWKRMSGLATLWLPGTDHAGIATQILVERMLREQGISRYEIGRETFLKHVWQWKEQYGERIVEQVKRMGASCDWSREHFTMDPDLTVAVQTAFLKLYDEGLIYRGERVIHWCVDDQTGISDLEVDYREEEGRLWYLRYPLTDGSGHVTVATTRPETMLGDTAVAVHPDDDRYRALVGKSVRLPLRPREIPIVADRGVDAAFGTGAVKVTPAHDAADFEIAQRHRLPTVTVIGSDGRMAPGAGEDYRGMTIREARERVVAELRDQGLLEREEPYRHNLAYCSRSNTVIEPLLSKQWFVRTKPLAAQALAALRSGRVKIVPERFQKVLVRWLTDIRDWNISRQLWWGHRLPVWYCIACDEPLAAVREPRRSCPRCGNRGFRQDDDTLDTWFSSGLWTFSTLGWPKRTADLERFHPTALLGTAWDILFFWVARMLMFSLHFLHEVPFRTVYLHGLVLNEHGQKMSKSKGTGVDPLVMIDRYGTDALRLALVVGTAPGQDFRLTESKIAGQRNFCNKLWNVSRYVLTHRLARGTRPTPKTLADRWILDRLNAVTRAVQRHLEQFQFSLATEELQRFLWRDYADWYLEMCKVEGNAAVLHHVLRRYLILLHPFAPFITEAIWSAVGERGLLTIEPWPKASLARGRPTVEREFHEFRRLVIGLRNLRKHGAAGQAVAVASRSAFNRDLVARLSGVTFVDAVADASALTLAGRQLSVPRPVATAFAAWRTRERQRLEQRLRHKELMAANDRAPAHVRDQARADLEAVQAQLAELGE